MIGTPGILRSFRTTKFGSELAVSHQPSAKPAASGGQPFLLLAGCCCDMLRRFTLARLCVKITLHRQIGPSEEFREVSRLATDVVVCARSAAPAGACDRHIRSGK